jgi:ABC-type microcin C transport system duplicated ATPase subunit YejF
LLSRDPRVVAATCNDVMILKRGRIVETGTPSQAFALPQHEHTRALVVAGKSRMRTLTRSPIGIDFVTVRGVRLTSRGPDVDFAIRRGESLAIVGRPGSGKSRIGRVVAGLRRAPKGLLVFEHDMYHGDDLPLHRRRQVSLVFRDPGNAFDPRLPIGTSLTEPLRLEPRLLIEEQAERLVELVRAVGLDPETLSALPAAFSHEELGRFALARALIARPLLLILDDPLAGLDVEQRAERLALIVRLRSDYSLTLLLLLDDLEVARILADRALILEAGQIVEEGMPGAMIEAPRQPLTEALVAARLADVGALPPGMIVE